MSCAEGYFEGFCRKTLINCLLPAQERLNSADFVESTASECDIILFKSCKSERSGSFIWLEQNMRKQEYLANEQSV